MSARWQKRRAAIATLLFVVACVAAPGTLRAQAIVLPSVRSGGITPEERVLGRFIDTVRALHVTKANLRTAEDSAMAASLEVRLDRLLLASIRRKQLQQLARDTSTKDSLETIAGDRLDPEGRQARRLLEAVKRVRGDAARALVRRTRERDTDLLLADLSLAEANDVSRAAMLDTLARVARLVVIQRKIQERVFWPVHSHDQAAVFWRQQGFAPLNVGAIAGTGSAGVAYTEVASPILQMFRVSMNTVLAASDKGNGQTPATGATAAGEDAAIKRLVTGGGLFNVAFAAPLVHLGWREEQATVMLLGVPRIGLTAPVLGATSTDTTTLALDAGVELHAKFTDRTDGVGVMGQLRWAGVAGSRHFGDALGLPGGRDELAYATASFGFLFGGQYILTASRIVGGPRTIRKSDWQIGLTAFRAPTS